MDASAGHPDRQHVRAQAERAGPVGVVADRLVGPCLFDYVGTDMSVCTEEVFGPVLVVLRVSTGHVALAGAGGRGRAVDALPDR
ncbi:aldehyde dehydrogenase family protein [Asanoa sp. NPDC049518]|uniref:aldehyde dehydrogenase family protein n=1 Tax=unclassified Asanoa TaxID=2685164 RepID=UPI00341A5999